MRNKLEISLLVIAFFLILPAFSLAAHSKVIKICDGDILRAKGCNTEIKVRLGLVVLKHPRERGQDNHIGRKPKSRLRGLYWIKK
jgi:hypothetical protein